MKQLFYLLLVIIIPLNILAQRTIKGKILDAETGEALAFANIISSHTKGSISNAEGNFFIEIDKNIKTIEISYLGYEKQLLPILTDKEYYIIRLKPAVESLGTVVLSGKYINPAIALMKRIIEKKSDNDYRKRFQKYSFVKYYKFLVTADPDSINTEIDSVFINGEFHKIDSSLYRFKEELVDKDMFIMESVMKVNTSNGDEKHKVIASRTAGLKNPMYEVLALQTANYNVYDDNYKFFIKEYLGPLTKLSLKQYQYEIDDTLKIQNRDVFVLSYLNTKKPLISGKIFVDKNSLAIAKMTLNTFRQFELRTVHTFDYYPEYDTWFPHHAQMHIQKARKKSKLSIDGVISIESKDKAVSTHTNNNKAIDYMYAVSNTTFTDIKIGNLHKDNIKYNLQIATDATKRSQEFWNNYRDMKRSKRELNTYNFIDSMAKKDGIETKLEIIRKLGRGYMPFGFIDFDVVKLVDKNEYEAYRLSLGGKTNEKLSNKFYIDAYAAYGFKDKELKYHGQLHYKLDHFTQSFLHAGITKDLTKSASFNNYNEGIFYSFLGNLSYDKFFMHTSYELGASHLFSKSLRANLNFKKQDLEVKYPMPVNLGGLEFAESKVTSVNLSLEFQPFSKFVLSPYGRENLKEGYPQFFLNIEKAIPLGTYGQSNFLRFDFQTKYKKTYLNKDYTETVLKFGYATEGTALTHLYSPNTNAYYDDNKNWYNKIHLRTNTSFETMRNLEFADNFVSTLHLSHTFSKIKITKKYNFDIKLIGRGAWGTSYAANRYAGIQSLREGYFETGIEFNSLVKLVGTGFGVGLYYRMGKNSFSVPLDNLSVKITVSPFRFFD